MTEVRHWIVTSHNSDFIPAFVDAARGGLPQIVVHGGDFVRMTRAEAEVVAMNRNAGQIASAHAEVSRLEAALDAARQHLARTRAILQPN